MSATVALPPEVAAYLDQVAAALADLPPEERDELLADVEVSLVEGAADGPPELRLGPPEQFAQELRAAAGLTVAAPAQTRSLRELLAALAAGPRARAARATALELAPVWWVGRGYVAACAIAFFAGQGWSEYYTLVPVRSAPGLGVALVVAAVVASVWLGLRTRRDGRRGRWLLALNLVLAVLTIPMLTQALEAPSDPAVTGDYYMAPQRGVAVNGIPVRNIYPYSRDGKLLLDILLYDESGRPLTVGSRDPRTDPLRRYVETVQRTPLLNTFPIRYFEPRSSRVADPTAAPRAIRPPEIQTPPLKVKRP